MSLLNDGWFVQGILLAHILNTHTLDPLQLLPLILVQLCSLTYFPDLPTIQFMITYVCKHLEGLGGNYHKSGR